MQCLSDSQASAAFPARVRFAPNSKLLGLLSLHSADFSVPTPGASFSFPQVSIYSFALRDADYKEPCLVYSLSLFLHQVLETVASIIGTGQHFDPNNPSVVICGKQLEEALCVKALHVDQLR
jgi:hypothetical protein